MVNGQKIKTLRESRGLTAADFGLKVGASQTMISFIELNYKSPSVDLLKRIADFLGVAMDDLITNSPNDEAVS